MKIFVLIILSVLITSYSCFADDLLEGCIKERMKIYHEKNLDPVEYEVLISCLTKLSLNKDLDEKKRRGYFKIIIEKWKSRDGAAWYSLSKAYVEVCKADQKIFFSMMSEELEVYNDWLSSLLYSYFTWFKDPPSPLNDIRKSLIKTLNEGEALNSEADELRKLLISTLNKIVPRQID